jgi:LiaF transmembrane domain
METMKSEQTQQEQPHVRDDSRSIYSRQLSKSPALAGVLSMLPGLGQVYVGYYKVGFMMISVFAVTIAILNATGESSLTPLFGIFLPFFYLYNIIDAIRRAKIYNQVLEGVSQAQLPEDFQMPGLAGSLMGGIALIVIGFLLFLNTMFDVSLVWLENWWPVALIFGGVYLVYKDMKSKGSDNLLDHITGRSGSADE